MGVIPAIVLPTSFLMQLVKILKDKSCFGVSRTTWLLQLIGQLGFYLLVRKHKHIFSLIAYASSCMIALIIFIYCSLNRSSNVKKIEKSPTI